MEDYLAGDFESVQTVIEALKKAYVHGEKQIRIVRPDKKSVSIVSLPDQDELAAFREICLEYQALANAGLLLDDTGSDETVVRFAEGLMELVDLARPDDALRHSKRREDVRGELEQNLAVALLGEFWESVKRKHSDIASRKFQLVRYKTKELIRIFKNAVKQDYIDRSTRKEDFLFYFDESYSGEPQGYVLWKQQQGLLSLFVNNLTSDTYKWYKSARVFKALDLKTNKYVAIRKDSLKALSSRERNDRDNFGDDLMSDLLA